MLVYDDVTCSHILMFYFSWELHRVWNYPSTSLTHTPFQYACPVLHLTHTHTDTHTQRHTERERERE